MEAQTRRRRPTLSAQRRTDREDVQGKTTRSRHGVAIEWTEINFE